MGIIEAVRQGRCREAENPGAYLTAAPREQSRLTDSGERKPRRQLDPQNFSSYWIYGI